MRSKCGNSFSIFTLFFCFLSLFSCKNSHSENKKNTFKRKTKQTVFQNTDSLQKLANKMDIANLSYQIDTFLATKNLNANVLVARFGKIIYKKSNGISNFSTKDSLNINSSFQLASVSKTITGLATLLLIDNGYLSLEDTIGQFIPNFPYKNIKIKHLLSHRSGLPNYMYFTKDYILQTDTILNNKDIINLLMTKIPEKSFVPDTKFAYCNTNFAILASIIEIITKETFEKFVETQIFKPLKMDNTFFLNPKDSTLQPNQTKGYVGNWNEVSPDMLDGVMGDKGVYSTLDDMYKFDQALYTDQLISIKLMNEAKKPRSFEKPGAKNYGYGFRLLEYEDKSWAVFHHGWWHGYNTSFFRIPNQNITIIILCNKFNRQVYYSIDGLLEILRGPVAKIIMDEETE